MSTRENRCFLFHLPFITLLLLTLPLARAQSGAAGTTPPAVISGRVTRYSSSGSTQGLAGIQVTAYSPVGISPIEQTLTNADGNYTLNLNLTGWQDIYLCAQDPDNLYVTECYDEHYWLYSATGQWGEGDKIGIGPNQKISRDFKLCQAGSIPISIDLPHNRGCMVFLQGTVNYKTKTTMTFPPGNPSWSRIFSDPNQKHYSLDLADYILEPASKIPIPPGDYRIWVKDSAQFFYDLEISNPHCTYSVNQIYYALPQSGTATISCEKPKADLLHFGSFAQAGMIYGIITDPNTKEKTSHLFRVVTEGWNGNPDLIIGTDPNHNMDLTNPQITFLTEDEDDDLGIKGIQVQIIPVNNEPVERSIIPAKVTSVPNADPNQPTVYRTGSYGGYAFKFLKPGGYKIRAFSRVGSSDVFSIFYGKNANTTGAADIVSLGTGESKQINFTLQETSISGKVVIQGGKATGVSASLLTKAHEQISFTLVDSSTGGFSFHGLISGDVILRLEKTGYGVVEQSLANLKLGEQRNIGTITMTPYQPCQGSGTIHGRVYLDENPQVGLANITVHAMDINHIGQQATCSGSTDSKGNYIISNLPSSGFIVLTSYDPKIVTEGYFNEMSENVTAFSCTAFAWYERCPWEWEIQTLTKVLQRLDPSHMDDPNILITPVYVTSGDKEVNIGLSTYNYPYSAGLNLFAYPGTPLNACDTADKFLSLFTYDPSRRISLRNDEKGGDMRYFDPNSHSLKGNNFFLEPGHGYVFYLNTEAKVQIPPFTIVPPPPINLSVGRTIVSVPDRPDNGFYAQDVLRTFGDNEKDANLNSTAISHFDGRKGKWRSSTWLWGKCAGDNFKIERSRGYLADIKKAIVWSREKSATP